MKTKLIEGIKMVARHHAAALAVCEKEKLRDNDWLSGFRDGQIVRARMALHSFFSGILYGQPSRKLIREISLAARESYLRNR